MAQIAVEKVNDAEKKTSPVFGEITKRLEAVQRRAFDLFEKRGRELGHELDDWLKAEHELFDWPAAEFARKDGAYELELALPGFEVKDVEVTATPAEIIIHAAAASEKKNKKDNVLWTEFGSNDLYRRFELPNPINVDRVAATLDNGVLKIKAPEAAKPKDVKVTAA